MNQKVKNILIFTAIAGVLVLGYIFFFGTSSEESGLETSSAVLPNIDGSLPETEMSETDLMTEDLVSLLLSVQKIKIDDSIFSDPAFNSLNDSNVDAELVPDNTHGRPNPFAQFGSDPVVVTTPTCVEPQVLDTLTNTCVSPVVE